MTRLSSYEMIVDLDKGVVIDFNNEVGLVCNSHGEEYFGNIHCYSIKQVDELLSRLFKIDT